MTNKIFTALSLLLFSGFTLLMAQQPPLQKKSKMKRVAGEQPVKKHNIFDNLDVTLNQSYNQSFSKDGVINLNSIISDFQVNENAGPPNQNSQDSPAIATDSSGNFVITWRDARNGVPDIYGQRFTSAGDAIGTNFKVNEDMGSAPKWNPVISSDGSGNFVIAWSDERNGDFDVYAQRYASDGGAIGPNFKVHDDSGRRAYQQKPSIATEGSGNFVITWMDLRNVGYDIYGQRFSNDGSVVGSNFRITNTGEHNQGSADVKLLNGRIFNTWTDDRGDSFDFDVWANVLDWENPTGINDKKLSRMPSAFILAQNYPNPFNPATTISYSLPKSGHVILTIYDMLGKKIQIIVDKFKEAAIYSVIFDASKLSTGIYFYKLQVDGYFLETKKMIFMR